VKSAIFHSQAFRPKPLALACGTLRRRHVIHQPVAIAFRSGLLEILLQVSENSAEASLAAARLAVQQQVLDFVGKLLKRHAEVDSVGCSHDLQTVDQTLRRRTRPQSAIEQRLRPVGDHLRRIEIVAVSEAVALGTRSIHTVEGERARLQLRYADAAIRASELFGVKLLIAADHGHLHQASSQLHRQAYRHFEAMLDARLHQQPVNHHFDGVVLALIEVEVVIQIHQLAVDAGAGIAVLEQRLHLFLEFAFASADDRRQHHYTILRRERHHALHDLLGRLAADGASAFGTMGNADGSEQEAKIVVDLGDGAHGRARAAAGGLLLDRDGWAKSINCINIRAFHLV